MTFTAGKYTSAVHIKTLQPGDTQLNHQFWLFKKCIKTTEKDNNFLFTVYLILSTMPEII